MRATRNHHQIINQLNYLFFLVVCLPRRMTISFIVFLVLAAFLLGVLAYFIGGYVGVGGKEQLQLFMILWIVFLIILGIGALWWTRANR